MIGARARRAWLPSPLAEAASATDIAFSLHRQGL
jgi:hypothetical protein